MAHGIRPAAREKLAADGAAALSDVELLAVLLGNLRLEFKLGHIGLLVQLRLLQFALRPNLCHLKGRVLRRLFLGGRFFVRLAVCIALLDIQLHAFQ